MCCEEAKTVFLYICLMRAVISNGDEIDPKKLKKGISWAESRGGNPLFMKNPTSSATGMYGQLYNQIKDLEPMQGVSRDSLINNPALQEMFMDMRIKEGIGGPSLSRNASDLEDEYRGQLGGDWNFRSDEVAALSHFLGRQGARKYFGSIRDNTSFQAPGVNKTPEEYLRIYNEGINR